jgi:DNA polymerase III subunit delta
VGVTTFEALQRVLANEAPGGAFFLYGEEEFLREQAVARIVHAHLDPGTADFNLDQLRGDDVSAEALASVFATPAMMAEWRVVVLRDAQGLSQKAREVVERTVTAPPPGLVLIIAAVIPAGSKAKFYGVLQKQAMAVEFARIEPLDAPGWLIEHARASHARELHVEAARALVAALGTDLRLLASELDKLTAYVGDRPEIAADDVRAVTGVIPRFDRWAWFDLVGERKIAEALTHLPTLLAAGETGVGLVIGLGAQLLRVALVCAGGAAALERELKPHQRWLARRVVPQARRWTLGEVDQALSELLRTDRLLKSASLTDRQAIEELLLRLHAIQPAREAAA